MISSPQSNKEDVRVILYITAVFVGFLWAQCYLKESVS